jgi:hypothetical protein
MIKRKTAVFLFILSLSSFSYGDWKSDIFNFLVDKKDYKGAIEYLFSYREKNEKIFNPAICGLLAYSFNKLNDKDNEYRWLSEYFEKYRGREAIFDFMDEATYAQIVDYFTFWRWRYPQVEEIALINSDIYSGPAPPDKFVISIDVRNNAYYKLSKKEQVLKGGLLKDGYNTIQIRANKLLEKSESHVFFLDLKTEDLVLRKEIEIDIQIESKNAGKKSIQSAQKSKDKEYRLSMYVGDKLIVMSKKLPSKPFAMKFKNPPWPENRKPFTPVETENPLANSVSILSAVSAIAKLIKDLRKDDEEYRVKPVQKLRQITAKYMKMNTEGLDQEVKAIVTLRSGKTKVFSFN